MATRIETHLIDDLDGSEGTTTVQFGLDGTDYEIDLNDAHADELRAELGRFANSARKVTGSRRAGAAVKSRQPGNNTKEIRAWAEANGHHVNARGRINASIIEAYEQAHSL